MKNRWLPANIRRPSSSVDLITPILRQSQLSNWKPSLVILIKFPDLWKSIKGLLKYTAVALKAHLFIAKSFWKSLHNITGVHTNSIILFN